MNQIPVDNDRGTAMKTSTWERRSRANGLVSTNVRPLQTRIPIPVASPDAIRGTLGIDCAAMSCSDCLHVALGLLLVGCGSVSSSPAKSTIRVIDVAHEAELRQNLVGPGMEVRWHNTLTEPIVISFPASVVNRISCKTGFKTEEQIGMSAVVEPNASASLCFASQGKYTYQVRLNQNPAGALADKRGIIWVVGRGERNPDPYEEYINITP